MSMRQISQQGVPINVYTVVIAFFVLSWVAEWTRRWWRGRHERKVELAAVEASEEDPGFLPDAVRRSTVRLFEEVQRARAHGDREHLTELLAPGLLAKELRRLDELERKGWRREIEVVELDPVEYLGLVNRAGTSDDRVTVRISGSVRDHVLDGDGDRAVASDRDIYKMMSENGENGASYLVQYWTLARRADGRDWIVAAIESEREGRHVFDAEVIASQASDLRRMTDASVLEVAALDRLPARISPAEIVDVHYAENARLAALDLSVVDGRWAPAVLEAAVRRAVDAWAAAVDGARDDLLDVATPETAQALLHPGDPTARTRLVVRGPRVSDVTITALDPAVSPPRMTVQFRVSGRRFIEDGNTGAMQSGIKWFSVPTTEHWTMALSGPDERPWRLVATKTTAHRILHWLVSVQHGWR
jgi:predicted lipid-binding transport protein (Tim44 family)